MRTLRKSIFLWVVVFVLMAGILCTATQRTQRPPWEERSPKVNKVVPDLKIYDENTQSHSFFQSLRKHPADRSVGRLYVTALAQKDLPCGGSTKSLQF